MAWLGGGDWSPIEGLSFTRYGSIFQLGREVVFLAGKRFPDFYIRRVDWFNAAGSGSHFSVNHLPAVVVFNVVGRRIDL